MKLTNGESLFIGRRRLGLTQTEISKAFGICETIYNRMELDKNKAQRIPLSRELEEFERYLLLRRRKGMTQKQLAKKLNCSRAWVNRMERGLVSCEKLTEYWKING